MIMKTYIKPEIKKIDLDNSISLVMMTWNPGDGKPPSPPGKPDRSGKSFESPFNDSPFS